jgi:hypothetical protein
MSLSYFGLGALVTFESVLNAAIGTFIASIFTSAASTYSHGLYWHTEGIPRTHTASTIISRLLAASKKLLWPL